MSPEWGLTAAVLLNLASGAVFCGLGAAALAHRARRGYARALGVFLLTWGVQILLANLSVFALDAGRAGLARGLLLASSAVFGFLPLFLVRFARSYPTPRSQTLKARTAGIVLACTGVAGLAAVVFAPTLVHQGFHGAAPYAHSLWGAVATAQVLLVAGAFLYATRVLHRRADEAEPLVQRRRARAGVTALILYLGYWGASTLVSSVAGLGTGSTGWGLATSLAYAAAGAASAATALVLGTRAAPGQSQHRHGALRQLLLVVLAPALTGAYAGAASVVPGLPYVGLLGMWRLITGALLAHAVFRFDVPDLDLRIAAAGVNALVWGAAAVGLVLGAALLIP